MNDHNPARITGEPPYLVNVSWCLDQYPNEPEFTAHRALTILDAEGPAMVTQFHVSDYFKKNSSLSDPSVANALWINIYYNSSDKAAVCMPLMDFLADVDTGCEPFTTVYFSKVKKSHNFYLPLPFEKHIKIVVENRSDMDLFGYMTLQVEPLPEWDHQLGYLHTAYVDDKALIPDEIIHLMDIKGNGSLVASWLQIKVNNPLANNGEYICEGNQLIYLDDMPKAALEYLGTEDLYGVSWGFSGTQSDGRCAVTRKEVNTDGLSLCMLRARVNDKIRFKKSCRLLVDYTQEFFSAASVNPFHANTKKTSFPISYKSCVYYYLTERKP